MIRAQAHRAWVAVEIGPSRLRGWAMTAQGEVSERHEAPMPAPDSIDAAMLELLGSWIDDGLRVLVCGDPGAGAGQAEALSVPVPCKPLALRPLQVAAPDPRITMCRLPGLRQERPVDVMWASAATVAGVLARMPGFDGILCLPGMRTRWAEISAEEIVSFRSFLTGELHAALAQHTVLRQDVGSGWNDDAFRDAVTDSLSRPEMLASRLFAIHAEATLRGPARDSAHARLMGHLIGAELAATRAYWLGRQIAVAGEGRRAAAYADALRIQGVTPVTLDRDEMLLAGLGALGGM